MRISEVELENFGPFQGKHRIELKSGVNITYGENGSGKTFLFKAISFALFGSLFSNINHTVINYRHLTHGGKKAKVTINFDLLGRQYKIERIILKNGTIKVKLHNGNEQTMEDIYQKVPPHTAPFFLLDGEEVRQWVMSIGRTKWDTASILGFSLYQAVLDDLRLVSSNLQARVTDIEARSGLTSMRTKIKSIIDDNKQNEKLIMQIEKDIIIIDENINDLKKLMSFVRIYHNILEKKEGLEKEISKLSNNIDHDWKQAKVKAQLLPYAIIRDEFNIALELINHMKNLSFDARLEQGRLDAQMELLSGIYDSEECICNRPLAASKFGKNSISELVFELNEETNKFEKAAKAEYWPTMELMDMRLRVDLAKNAAGELNNYLKNIKQLESKIKIKNNDLKRVNIEWTKIEKKILILVNKNNIELKKDRWQKITDIEQLLLRNERKHSKFKGRIDAYQEIINGNLRKINEINKEMKKALSIEKERISKFKTEQQKIQTMMNEIENAVKKSVEDMLMVLEGKVKEIFKMITNKPREYVSINLSNEDGVPRIITESGNTLSMNEISDGERHVVMFSLISALKNMSPAEVLVIDAPFGRLDSKHISSILLNLPSLAPQTILFLTDREFQEIGKSKIVSKVWHIKKDGKSNKLECVV